MLLNTLLWLAALTTVPAADPCDPYRAAAHTRWEADLQQLEALDQSQPDPEHAILFIGSSSIRLWETMAEDMAPWPTIRRGYGGAKLSDLGVFVERLVNPHEFDALAIFVANDISGSETDKTPEQVLELYQQIVAKVRKKHAEQPIYFIAITPTSSRFHVWEPINQANELIFEYCRATPNLHYIDTRSSYLTAAGKPNDDLFRQDKLHLNREGYRLWGKLIKAAIAKELPAP